MLRRMNSTVARATLLAQIFHSAARLYNGVERSLRVRGRVVQAHDSYCFLRPFAADCLGTTSSRLNIYANLRHMNKNNPLREGDIVEFTVERTSYRDSEVAVDVSLDPPEYKRRYVKQPSQTTKYYEPIFGNDKFPKPWSGAVTASGKVPSTLYFRTSRRSARRRRTRRHLLKLRLPQVWREPASSILRHLHLLRRSCSTRRRSMR